MHTTRAGTALVAAVLGAAVALIGAVAETRVRGYPPELTAAAPGAIGVVVLGLLVAVRYMRVRLRATATVPPDPHLAFRLFVLARASTLVGAALTGAYLALGAQRLWFERGTANHSQLLVAGVGVGVSAAMTVVAVVLERSCRSPGDPPGSAVADDGSGWGPSVAGGSGHRTG